MTRLNLLSLLSILLLLWITPVSAQTYRLTGALQTAEGPLPYASVILRQATDSTLVKAELSTPGGTFGFSTLTPGTYALDIKVNGLEPVWQTVIIENASVKLPPITLESTAYTLDEVSFVAQKPLIEVLADKTVFNVENTLNATGTDAFSLLRQAPGVIVDNQDQIILDGKTGVIIYINGKQSPLSGTDLTQFLRSIPSSDIASIELITQPSSKYDAAGASGIINIILKKDKRLGTNGTVNSGYGYGRNGRGNASLNLNHRNKVANLFGSYSYNQGQAWDFLYLDRTQSGVRYDSKTDNLRNWMTHNLRAGGDFFLNDQHTLGLLVYGSKADRTYDGLSETPIIPLTNNEVSQILIADNSGQNGSQNLNGNLNYRFADTSGHELLVDIDYGVYDLNSLSDQPNRYVSPDRQATLLERNFSMDTRTFIDLFSVKADYEQRALGGVLGIGGRISRVQTDNVFDFFDLDADGLRTFNPNRSNQFFYTEQINAGYVNYQKKWGKWSTQFGLRAEQTISEGDLRSTQATNDALVQRNYLNWFPSGGLTYAPSYKNSWALTFSRRIQRPNYQNLNPFESQIDELSFSKGNPFLQPQYTSNFKLAHTHKYRFTTSVSYSFIEDFFAKVTDTIGQTRNFLITRNVANQHVWSLGLSYPFSIKDWWNVYISLNAYRASYRGTDDKFQSIDQNTASGYAQSTFLLPKGYRFEVSGWWSSPSVWGGTYLTKSLGSLNLAFQKKLLDDQLSLRLAFSDILFTSPWRADMQYGELYINGTGGGESRRVSFNLTYTFGNQNVKKARRRKTGLEDESKRISN